MSHYSNDSRDVVLISSRLQESGIQQNKYIGVKTIKPQYMTLLRDHLKGRLEGMWAVCLEPYNQFSHPLMVLVDDLPNHFSDSY